MENDLNISLQGFNNEDDAQKIGNLALEVIKALETEHQLNIVKLKKVVVSFDFPSALAQIAEEFNHQSLPTFTDSKQAIAIAQLLSKPADNGRLSEYALVLSISFFSEIITTDGAISFDNIAPIIHRIHHELIHVHEHNENSLDNSKIIDDYDDALLMTGKRAWSEYLANYMSSSTATDDCIHDVLNTLETVLSEVPIEIEDLVYRYQIKLLPLAEMHYKVTERIKLIANMYGYAQGYIQALDIDMEAHFPKLQHLQSSSKLASPLSDLGEAIDSIKAKFEEHGLDHYNDFNSATSAIAEMYSAFGLRIERNAKPNTGLYVHVG
ncbi:hypothetical protein GCM10007916_01550 [Psychromonas marina]|uniref:Uncharacterized protein n=1 Tax=Psychromonas marina TaxID=88364 RepID=A0ABQ6DVE1_9GAMM|nr:hypothetical protein [Psychromonas marina]GLS89088.1 hypothetical protein GCM10007916_01550 [Psychromonas marina]